ncbi:MAG: DUF3160 domain-containing protein, partial [Planctomycetota bacterium]
MSRYKRWTGVVVALVLAANSEVLAGGWRPPDTPDPAKGYKWGAAAKRHLTPDQIKQLDRDKILVTNQAFKQVFTPYLESDLPLFITSDSLLNAFHVLYEESVMRMEQANAGRLTEILLTVWKNLPSAAKNVKGKPKLTAAALRRAQVVVGTALKLLGDGTTKPDKDVAKLIDAEVKRITEAKAQMKPAWLGPPDDTFLALDYSRYKPRGFYTKSERLKRYFRAVSWLQSIPFRVSKDEELLAILMLGNTVTSGRFHTDFAREEAFRSYFQCYRRFVGAGDDWDLMDAAHEAQNEISDLADKRAWLLKKARGHGEGPKINDQVRFAPDDPSVTAEPNFRVISAYRTPDAILFQRTTDRRQFRAPLRPFPDGLEVCAALGSSFARSKLTYEDRKKLLAKIDGAKPLFKGHSLYCQYLRAVSALLDEPEPDAPKFMSRAPWQIKSCQAALAGWAQLRHTWALQAKQTVHYMGLTMKPPGFVEPEPDFFARMADLVAATETLLEKVGAFEPNTSDLVGKLRTGADLLEEKGADKKGREALKNLTDAERVVVAEPAELLMNTAPKYMARIMDSKPEDSGKLLIKGMRELADQLETGNVPDDRLFRRVLAEAQFDLQPLWRRLQTVCLKLEALAHKQLRGT